MKPKKIISAALLISFTVGAGFFIKKAFAHCDTLDGPVVLAAKKSLATGNINYAIIWVQEEQQAEIKEAFESAVSVRKISKAAQQFADKSFYETLVRVHRAGEGAPYNGLKPAGFDMGPAIPAADKSIISGNTADLEKFLILKMKESLDKYFKELQEKKNYNVNDVKAGRAYVKAYVEYIHSVERMYQSTVVPAHGHFDEH